MSSSAKFFSPAEAARRLGVSAKALRLYEQRGLIAPSRSSAGWRAYGPDAMARAAEIASLQQRMHVGGAIAVILVMLALTGMALSHPIAG